MKKISLSLSFVIVFAFMLSSQITSRLAVDFTVDNHILKNPLVGGLNAPQFSAVDLNNDGKLDLFVFDRVGDRKLTFLNEGSSGQSNYQYAPEYENNFPPVKGWMMLRDYDGDGISDIFAYSDAIVSAVMVYRGYYEDDKMAFERFNFPNELNSILPDGILPQLYVSEIDYPAVDDIDCDGDLDIMTFSVGGGYIYWYKNTSVEEGFGRDSLHYTLEEICWGGMFESGVSNEVNLASAQGGCYDGFDGEIIEDRHSGSTLLTFDIDNDGDKELLLGDISFNNINYLKNGGDCNEAWFNEQTDVFPVETEGVDIPVFPATFSLDVNNDGLKDILVSPNSRTASEDHDIAWFYENTSSNETPVFELQKRDFMVDEMLDFGSGAQPVFVDYNADGLLDLVVGNYAFYQPFGERDPRLFLFLNRGTELNPAFELEDDNFLNMSQFSQSSYNYAPSFGDLDGDGDLDILIGEASGRLFYGENTAGAGNSMQFAPVFYDYQSIDVGNSSTPQIIDLDRDGLLDLVIGEKNGNINFLKNTGTTTAPEFNPDSMQPPNVFQLGGIDTRVPGYSTGHSAPFIMHTETDGYRLYTGSELGQIEVYSNIDNNISGTFTTDTEIFGNLQEGIRTHLAFADLNNDGLLEVAIGNFRGGLSIYTTDIPNDMNVGTTNLSTTFDLKLFPNPAQKSFNISISNEKLIQKRLEIYDITGRSMHAQNWTSLNIELNVSSFPTGIYFVKVSTEDGIQVKRLVVE